MIYSLTLNGNPMGPIKVLPHPAPTSKVAGAGPGTEWEYGVRETAQHLELRQAASATVLLGNLGDGLHFCGLQSSLSVKARVESEN